MKFIKTPVKGMCDMLPSDMRLREHVLGMIKETYSRYGFMQIETPVMEHIENLTSKQGGDNEKLIFKVMKRGAELARAMEKGDEKAVKVYLEIGRFLAHAIPWYNEFYDYENMMILGRVTSGLGGSIILESAKRFLKDVYPEWAEKIDVFMPDEQARRLGQSVAAAQIPVIKKR